MNNEKTEQLFKQFIQNVGNLCRTNSSVLPFSDYKTLCEKAFDSIVDLNKDYENKYIQSIYYNNELYEFFNGQAKTISEEKKKKIASIIEHEQDELEEIDEELELEKRKLVQEYKKYENDFLPKAMFLTDNKKNNKENYINQATIINQERVNHKHNYEIIVDDLSNKNEQIQNEFKHIEDRFTEKYNADM